MAQLSNTSIPSGYIPLPVGSDDGARKTLSLALPSGDAGVKMTIDAMQQMALGPEGARNQYVREWALAATQQAATRDDIAQASAIYNAVKNNIKFRGEYSETVQSPLRTLQLRAGDCDDHATLVVGLLRAIGIPARFITVATDQSQEFSHVYALAGIRRAGQIVQWLPLDTTVASGYPGWQPPRVTRREFWSALSGLGEGDESRQQSQPISQKAANTSAVIQQVGTSVAQVVSAFRNRDNTTTFNAQRMPGGISGSVGTSPTTLAVGGLVAAGVLAALLRRR